MALPFFLYSEFPIDVEIAFRPLNDDLLNQGEEKLAACLHRSIAVYCGDEFRQELVSALRFQMPQLFLFLRAL